MVIFNPPHRGETLFEDVLPELGIGIAELARRLGIASESLSRVLHGHAPINPDLVVRLELAGIGKACTWLGAQADYDLWQARQREPLHAERLAAIA